MGKLIGQLVPHLRRLFEASLGYPVGQASATMRLCRRTRNTRLDKDPPSFRERCNALHRLAASLSTHASWLTAVHAPRSFM